MKLQTLLYFLSLIVGLFIGSGCNDESGMELYLEQDGLQPIPVSNSTISCTVNQTDRLLVFGGAGRYDAFSSNSILEPFIEDNFVIKITPQKVGKTELTVMDDIHNQQKVTILVNPEVRKYQINEISYAIEGGSDEEKESLRNELSAAEDLQNAAFEFTFEESEAGVLSLILGSQDILIDNIPFVWDAASQSLCVSFPDRIVCFDENQADSRRDANEGSWETDLTADFCTSYPEVKSVKKILSYRRVL